MLSSAWEKHWMVKMPISKICISPTFQCYVKNLLLLMLVLLFFPLHFLLQALWNFTWHNSSCDFVAFGLIKYNAFQASSNKLDQTPYLIPRTNFKVQTLQGQLAGQQGTTNFIGTSLLVLWVLTKHKVLTYLTTSGHKWSMTHKVLKSHRTKMGIIDM